MYRNKLILAALSSTLIFGAAAGAGYAAPGDGPRQHPGRHGPMLAQVFALARILRMICHGHALMVGAMTLVLLVPSMILSEYLQHFLGIYPA